MQIVEVLADANVLDAAGQPTYAIRAGQQYLVHDSEAGYGLRSGALKLIAGLDRRLAMYDGRPLERQRLILPLIGRRGDAVVVASCLSALKGRDLDVTVDIAAPDSTREVLELMPRLGDLLPYPLAAAQLADYDYYLSFEEVEAVPRGWRRSCADVFSACLRTPRPSGPPHVTIPPGVLQRQALPPTDRPRMAVHVGSGDSPRSYPPDLLELLAQRLVAAEYAVYLIGGSEAVGVVQASDGEYVHDLCGQTPTPADLAAVITQMDAVITSDSFPLHLAGSIGVPAVALFTTTDAVLGSDYPGIVTMQSRAACSPCRTTVGQCPLGHHECVAHRDGSLTPESIVERAESLMAVTAGA